MMSIIQVFRRLFQFSVAFNIFKVMVFTKSQRLFMLNTYFECKNYAAIARRFHAEFNIHIDRTTISRTIKKFREDGNLTTRCATQRSELSTDVTNQIVRFFIRNPRMSLRNAAAMLRLSRKKIRKTLKNLKFKPYKRRNVQYLSATDRESRYF